MKLRSVFVVGLLVSVAAGGSLGCGSDSDGDDGSSGTTGTVTSEGQVEGVTWTLTELNGEAPPEGVEATLSFDGSTVSGNSGCNTYSGAATFDEDVVKISDQLTSTLIACEPTVGEFEGAYLTMLADASIFAADGDTLTLSNDSDTVLATFTSA
jgi:heat shock protein HslJ